MVEFEVFMEVGLRKCAPNGEGTGERRKEVFSKLVELWNRRKDDIRQMSKAQCERDLNCP